MVSLRTSLVTLFAALLLGACDGDDSATTGVDGTGGGETTTTVATGGVDWDPVECGGIVCEGVELCVQPGSICDYSETGGMIVTLDPFCAAVPAECEPEDLELCLANAYCEGSAQPEPFGFSEGLLECWLQWLHCP